MIQRGLLGSCRLLSGNYNHSHHGGAETRRRTEKVPPNESLSTSGRTIGLRYASA